MAVEHATDQGAAEVSFLICAAQRAYALGRHQEVRDLLERIDQAQSQLAGQWRRRERALLKAAQLEEARVVRPSYGGVASAGLDRAEYRNTSTREQASFRYGTKVTAQGKATPGEGRPHGDSTWQGKQASMGSRPGEAVGKPQGKPQGKGARDCDGKRA